MGRRYQYRISKQHKIYILGRKLEMRNNKLCQMSAHKLAVFLTPKLIGNSKQFDHTSCIELSMQFMQIVKACTTSITFFTTLKHSLIKSRLLNYCFETLADNIQTLRPLTERNSATCYST